VIISVKSVATVDLTPSGTLTVDKDDLLAFTFTSLGANTSGSWALYYDGTKAGLKNQNVDATWVDPINADVYLSVDKNFNLDGVKGDPGTVFICDPDTPAPITACNYSIYWDAGAAGIPKNIEGIDIQR
jgi:hypothetical protein